MKILETERLILRPFYAGDLDDLHEYAKSEKVGPCAGWKPHEDKNESLGILSAFMEGDEVWAIQHRDHGNVMGSIGLHPADPKRPNTGCRTIGYVLGVPYWSQGYATEAAFTVMRHAFEDLGLEMLAIYHYPFNRRSQRVVEKLGFMREGVLRQSAKIYDGSLLDEVCYSLTREEYLNRQK